MTTAMENILLFEDNQLSEADTIKMFQELVDSGDIWKLPTEYQSSAAALIQWGKLTKSSKVLN